MAWTHATSSSKQTDTNAQTEADPWLGCVWGVWFGRGAATSGSGSCFGLDGQQLPRHPFVLASLAWTRGAAWISREQQASSTSLPGVATRDACVCLAPLAKAICCCPVWCGVGVAFARDLFLFSVSAGIAIFNIHSKPPSGVHATAVLLASTLGLVEVHEKVCRPD